MQRISVDFPEPDGPQITIRSPRATVRETLCRTLKSPYHFCRPAISMIVGVWEAPVAPAGRPRETDIGVLAGSGGVGGRQTGRRLPRHWTMDTGRAASPSPVLGI